MTDTYSPDQFQSIVDNEPKLADLPEEYRHKLSKLIGILLEGQSRLNLTAVKEPAAIARLHLADSLSLLDFWPNHSVERAGDIGTGAGFPLLPLAICKPEITSWTGIESIRKKTVYIQEAAAVLGLQNVSVQPERAEVLARGNFRHSLDLVTARAVGSISALLESGLPLLRNGGTMVLYKTESSIPELEACDGIIKKLGGQIYKLNHYRFDGDLQDRVLMHIRKVKYTPDEFPRAAGLPFKKPLVEKPS